MTSQLEFFAREEFELPGCISPTSYALGSRRVSVGAPFRTTDETGERSSPASHHIRPDIVRRIIISDEAF